MFCDNPRCELHQYEDTSRNTLIIKIGGAGDYPINKLDTIKTKQYHNHKAVEPYSGQTFNLCDVCVGVLSVENYIREKHRDLPFLASAVTEAVNNENDQY